MKLTYFRDENKTVRSDVQPFDISFYKDAAYFVN